VQDKLEQDWSPEQIAAWLRLEHPGRPGWQMCHETIYQALYTGRAGLSRTLTGRLRTGRPLRKRRRRALARSPRYASPATLIDERPDAANARRRLGDWEGDLIVGHQSRSAIGTIVDRRSRYTKLVHLPGGHTARHLVTGLADTMADLPTAHRLTLTWDQGSEMAAHHEVAEVATLFGEGIFFAHAGKPWQRGTNENTNRLLRQYFPRAVTSASTPRPTSARSRNASTTGPARSSNGALQHKSSPPG